MPADEPEGIDAAHRSSERGSSGPIPLVLLGAIFAGVGIYLFATQPIARGIGLPFAAIGAVTFVAGVAWA